MVLSEEVKSKLNIYLKLLEKWQPKINLISNNTLDDAWSRHFEDSLQLLDILPDESQKIFDIGTGAGFPGLVLSIANSKYQVSLIESDQKKCSFLKTVSRETNSNAEIINKRIEDVGVNIIPNIVTARALAPLDKLFGYCKDLIEQNPQIQLVFMKGENSESEVIELDKNWTYKKCTFQSKTNKTSKIYVFTNISRL